eukprot:13539431-Alexandrium_andersonii.AAC.1
MCIRDRTRPLQRPDGSRPSALPCRGSLHWRLRRPPHPDGSRPFALLKLLRHPDGSRSFAL